MPKITLTCADFKPPSLDGKRRYLVDIVAGSATTAVVLLILILGIMRRKGWLGSKLSPDKGTLDLNYYFLLLQYLKERKKN